MALSNRTWLEQAEKKGVYEDIINIPTKQFTPSPSGFFQFNNSSVLPSNQMLTTLPVVVTDRRFGLEPGVYLQDGVDSKGDIKYRLIDEVTTSQLDFASARTISNAPLDIIKDNKSLLKTPTPDIDGNWTIGYGTNVLKNYDELYSIVGDKIPDLKSLKSLENITNPNFRGNNTIDNTTNINTTVQTVPNSGVLINDYFGSPEQINIGQATFDRTTSDTTNKLFKPDVSVQNAEVLTELQKEVNPRTITGALLSINPIIQSSSNGNIGPSGFSTNSSGGSFGNFSSFAGSATSNFGTGTGSSSSGNSGNFNSSSSNINSNIDTKSAILSGSGLGAGSSSGVISQSLGAVEGNTIARNVSKILSSQSSLGNSTEIAKGLAGNFPNDLNSTITALTDIVPGSSTISTNNLSRSPTGTTSGSTGTNTFGASDNPGSIDFTGNNTVGTNSNFIPASFTNINNNVIVQKQIPNAMPANLQNILKQTPGGVNAVFTSPPNTGNINPLLTNVVSTTSIEPTNLSQITDDIQSLFDSSPQVLSIDNINSMFAGKFGAEEADKLLRLQLQKDEQVVKDTVDIPLTQGQYDGLVSFVNDIGAEEFKKSAVLKAINDGNIPLAQAEMECYASTASGSDRSERRAAEIARMSDAPRSANTEDITRPPQVRNLEGICVDFEFTKKFEFNPAATKIKINEGTVPWSPGQANNNSGVTIGYGVDLAGQGTSTIKSYAISDSLKAKLIPYTYPNLKKQAAVDYLQANPLTITLEEVEILSEQVKFGILNTFIIRFNKSSKVGFKDLPCDFQTIGFDCAYQYGPFTRQQFVTSMIDGNWTDVEKLLIEESKSGPAWLRQRQKARAILIRRGLDSQRNIA